MFWMKAGPKVNKRVERLLRETQHLLLDAHRAKEDAEGNVGILEKREKRLLAMLQPKVPENVATGDITQDQANPATIVAINNAHTRHG